MIISLLLPSRKRPHNLNRFFRSILDTATDLDKIDVVVKIDSDDIESINYFKPANINIVTNNKIEVHVLSCGQFNYLSNNWNECWLNSTGDILQLCSDDIVYRTKGWDEKVRKEFMQHEDKILLLYTKDGGKNKATHPFIHRQWAEIVGYFVPYNHIYGIDTWLERVACGLKRRVILDDVLIEHMHYSLGKSKIDEVSKELKYKRKIYNDLKKFQDTKHLRDRDIKKLKRYIEYCQNERINQC